MKDVDLDRMLDALREQPMPEADAHLADRVMCGLRIRKASLPAGLLGAAASIALLVSALIGYFSAADHDHGELTGPPPQTGLGGNELLASR